MRLWHGFAFHGDDGQVVLAVHALERLQLDGNGLARIGLEEIEDNQIRVLVQNGVQIHRVPKDVLGLNLRTRVAREEVGHGHTRHHHQSGTK